MLVSMCRKFGFLLFGLGVGDLLAQKTALGRHGDMEVLRRARIQDSLDG